ncbi:GNAT family N-acetyltransferase [Actinoplanes bogorensis]|uniref:GNAT family N-acetyltransferase n=1 Tax=Paractinoplanes bogorensis TaxID=1610840 RepID=A0ABS5YSE2_9ACTN|nr:GNAT family N-acetyltransferase [Actinoplanes bogorensis]MBU2664950.1 GNAT family N-acetyltransferase [Actinoplanes bogorensis]
MLVDLWPQYALRLTTPRLELRLPGEDELVALAELAAVGIHAPGERPFLTPWTEGTATDRARNVLRGHWGALAEWEPYGWDLGLGVFREGTAIGMVSMRARDFPVIRQVVTSSWLGRRFQGQGYGTEARTALLALAFDHLGATDALTEVFQDNHASQGVSRKLGYQPDGVSIDARDGEALTSDRLRLTRGRWLSSVHDPVTVTGLELEPYGL